MHRYPGKDGPGVSILPDCAEVLDVATIEFRFALLQEKLYTEKVEALVANGMCS